MSKVLLKREQVNENETWDLTGLFASEQKYEEALSELKDKIKAFRLSYEGNLKDSTTITRALNEMMEIRELSAQTSTYAHLDVQTDQFNEEASTRYGILAQAFAGFKEELVFFESELNAVDESILEKVKEDKKLEGYINNFLREKTLRLAPEVESALAQFAQVFDMPGSTYRKIKMADLVFDPFVVDDQEYPLSFVLFENEWEYEVNHDLRRAAYQAFYQKLDQYKNAFATNYQLQVLQEKAQSKLRGFDSVIDYLLFDQKVTREMYDRQIDVIMSELAPAMRKFALCLKDIHGLDRLTFADLKLPVDDEFEPNITIEESRKYMLEGLEILGPDYLEMINRAFDEHWIDFPQNLGKSTGAFCSSPYGAHPFILISWTKRMREVFVLAHELGHAGHFKMAGENQNIFDTRASLYFIEAPSTMNEMIMANHLMKQADEPRMKRWVLSSMISRTYYHNFVTHLLEAAYQRDVYRAVDEGQPLSAKLLSELKLKALRSFWGDTVEIPDDAGLTWMRQPHYYSGLYPYTYSAGLTIATNVSEKLLKGELEIEAWKEVLKTGGLKDPMGLAAMVGVDLSTEEPLRFTLKKISSMIDEIVEITQRLK